VEAVKDLWEKSGMKTNGRKLLIDSEDEGRLNPGEGQHNLGYESDLSDLSVPRLGPRVGGRRVRRNGSQSSSTTLESGDGPNSKPRLVRSDTGGSWELRGAAGDSVDLDRVNLEDETDSRHVRFSGQWRNSPAGDKLIYGNVAATRWVGGGNSIWERYYGSTATAGDLAALEAGGGNMRRAAGSNFGSGFTLDQMASNLLRKNEKKRKKMKCFCKTFCVLLLLSTFVLVIVAVSILLTRGRKTFGSM